MSTRKLSQTLRTTRSPENVASMVVERCASAAPISSVLLPPAFTESLAPFALPSLPYFDPFTSGLDPFGDLEIEPSFPSERGIFPQPALSPTLPSPALFRRHQANDESDDLRPTLCRWAG